MYHVSDDHRLTRLSPRIPKNQLTETGIEDATIPRVCLSKTIAGALKGISRNICDDLLFVYEVEPGTPYVDSQDILQHVPDALLTQEIWSLVPVTIRYVKAIEIQDGEFLGIYQCPSGLEVENWEWQWQDVTPKQLDEYGYCQERAG